MKYRKANTKKFSYKVTVTNGGTGRASIFIFKGDGASQKAFDLANKNVFEYGNAVVIDADLLGKEIENER